MDSSEFVFGYNFYVFSCHFRIPSKYWWMPSSTLDPVRTPPVSVVPELFVAKPWMCPHFVAWTRPSGCSAPEPGRPASGTSRALPSAWPMSSSMQPRVAPTATPSRRRTSLSVLPSPIVKGYICYAGLKYRVLLWVSGFAFIHMAEQVQKYTTWKQKLILLLAFSLIFLPNLVYMVQCVEFTL